MPTSEALLTPSSGRVKERRASILPMRSHRTPLVAATFLAALPVLWNSTEVAAASRYVTFEERVAAQEAIERVYYAHQIGTTNPFEEAVSREVLENKVRAYLRQSVALEELWQTPVTAEGLAAELQRMAESSRLPERLQELYAALNNDVFLIQECLARPVLANRLARNFFATDERIHAAARHEIEELRQRLIGGALDLNADAPSRNLLELRLVDDRETGLTRHFDASLPDRQEGEPILVELRPEDFNRWRARMPQRVGEIGPVTEEHDAFVVEVVLAEETGRLQAVTYRSMKTTWETWWAGIEPHFDELKVKPVASDLEILPAPRVQAVAGWMAGQEGQAVTCVEDDTWDNGSMGDFPDHRSGHGAIWTGSVMVVFGGSTAGNTGERYDPTTDSWTPTSRVNAPAPGHGVAVWTGAEMIVWAGYDGTYLNTGGRYDPATDSWRPISRVNAPSPRVGHTAVWTGSRMVVWGGYDSTLLNTGGRYDPVTDSWTPTSRVNAPAPRSSHTGVWTGSRMVVWGGIVNGEGSSGGRYDPVADTWTPTSTANAPSPRYGHTGVWTGKTMVVWGGYGHTGAGFLNTGGRYDPVTDSWTPTSMSNAPSARQYPTAVWTGSVMVVWGGAPGSVERLNTGGRYDPVSDSWTATSRLNAPSPRYGHTAVWTGSLMVVWGGEGGGNSGGRYDPVTDSWTPTSRRGNAPTARSGHTAVWTGSLMIVWGGGVFFNTGGRYDPVTDSWTPTSTLNAPSPRINHTAVWTGSRMVVWGGSGGSDLSTGGRYDPVVDSWQTTSTANAPSPRRRHTAVWTGSRMVVWGGAEFITFLDTGGRYDPVTDSWTPTSTANAPSPRYDHTAVWTGSRMVVWGGRDLFGNFFNTVGQYDLAADSWLPTSTANAPSPRYDHTAVWTGSRMVVWGGRDAGAYFNTGGRYDPAADSWTATSTGDAPSARYDHTAVWTGTRMIVWGDIFGSNTGGRYDPTADSWTPTSTRDVPSPRSGHTSVWTGSAMIVWGGSGSGTSLSTGGRYAMGQAVDDDGDGLSECQGDCDDTEPAIYLGAEERCDGKDNDCEGMLSPEEADADGDGFRGCGGDCNDADPLANPAATDLPGDRRDENCDGSLLCDPDAAWKTRGQFVACVARECHQLVEADLVTARQCQNLVLRAARLMADLGSR